MFESPDIYELLAIRAGQATAICGFLYTLYRVLKGPAFRMYSTIQAIRMLPAQMADIQQSLRDLSSHVVSMRTRLEAVDQRVAEVEYELKPNGGGNLRGAVERLENAQIITTTTAEYVLTDSGVATFMCNPSGEFVKLSRSLALMLGFQGEQLMGHGWRNAIDREHAPEIIGAWESAIADRREFHRVVKFRSPDGALVCARMLAGPMANTRMEHIGYTGVVRPMRCKDCKRSECVPRTQQK